MVADTKERKSRVLTIPIGLRLKARNLYINQGLPTAQVANLCGMKTEQVKQLAFREGWTKIRRANEARLAARADAHTEEHLDEVSRAIGAECDEHSLSALKRTGESLASNSEYASKDAQAFSQTLKNLVTVARTVRGMDGKQEAAAAVNIAFFFAGPQRAEPENVTPAITV